jgi:Xaa-Pro aminopeptidase
VPVCDLTWSASSVLYFIFSSLSGNISVWLLQGHIGLDQAIFPEGTPGLALDTLARAPLWSLGLNYRHGTGHGVGAALNVHEGPHSISTRYGCNSSCKCGLMI